VFGNRGISGGVNFRWGSFDLKLEVIVPFLSFKRDFRATGGTWPSQTLNQALTNYLKINFFPLTWT